MCGICGAIWNHPGDRIEESVFQRMLDRLAHRGPDGQGIRYLEHGGEAGKERVDLVLGHRRLSIIDLSEGGSQPMADATGKICLTFNGEIYNEAEYRPMFLDRGYRFRGTSDCEIILPLYREYGDAFLERLNGMFAFGLWDDERRRLLLVRDRLGKKPLYYALQKTSNGERLVFASELKSLLEIPDLPRTIDPTALDDYLTYQYVPHPKTIYREIKKLPPGHLAVYEKGILNVRRYWNPGIELENGSLTHGEWLSELRRLLSDAVKIRMRSDVPIGAFLSGGIDSTITAGLMQRLAPDRIKTFSIGFEESEYDESKYASLAARRFGTEHFRLVVRPNPKELIETILPKLVEFYDEPFADSSAIPTWYLCRLAGEQVTVALSGDGGDELFAGYERYQAVRLGALIDRLPLFLRHFLAGPVMRAVPASVRQRSPLRRLKRFLEALAMEPTERYLQWIATFNRERREALYTGDFLHRLDGYDSIGFLETVMRRVAHRDPAGQASLADLLTYLPCDLMTKVDTASMAHALECRAPILDYRIVELAVRMPIAQKIQGRTGKKIFREAFADLLPEEIRKRGKMGFGVPLDHWFRGPLKNYVREVLLDRHTVERGFFRRDYVEALLEEHFAGEFDHAYRIWSLLFLELWLRRRESAER